MCTVECHARKRTDLCHKTGERQTRKVIHATRPEQAHSETEVAWGPPGEGRVTGRDCWRVSLWGDEKVLEFEAGGGCVPEYTKITELYTNWETSWCVSFISAKLSFRKLRSDTGFTGSGLGESRRDAPPLRLKTCLRRRHSTIRARPPSLPFNGSPS